MIYVIIQGNYAGVCWNLFEGTEWMRGCVIKSKINILIFAFKENGWGKTSILGNYVGVFFNIIVGTEWREDVLLFQQKIHLFFTLKIMEKMCD